MLDFKIQRLDNIKFNHAELVAYFHTLKHNYDHMKWQAPPGEFSDLAYSWAIQTKMKDATRPCSPYHLPTDDPNDFIGDFDRPTELIFGFGKKIIDAFPEGVRRCFTTLDNYVQGIKQIFTGKVNPNDSLGSLISIGNTFPSSWDWERFWTLTAIFSIILAFMNVLPIPALDGGHALFILFEMITGRKPSDKFMEYAQIVGMVLMFGLMFYALGLDFWRLFK
jgi:membrane-associated protease RseP (regulator of RpoE activity)